MNKKVIFFLVVLFVSVLSSCVAETYTAKTGPFTIQVDSNEEVEFSYIAEPYAEDNFNLYEVMMDIGDDCTIDIEIHDYGRATDISDFALMQSIINYFPLWEGFYTSWEAIDAGGKPGTIASIEKKGKTEKGLSIDPMCVAAYSPDGFGDRGSVIAVIAGNAKEETFKEDRAMFEGIMKNLRISRE